MNNFIIPRASFISTKNLYYGCIFLSFLAIISTLPSFFINSYQDFSYFISALRIFLTFILLFSLIRHRKILLLIRGGITSCIIFNAILITINLFFPSLTEKISQITNEPNEFFRFSAFWGSYQLPSFLYILHLTLIRPLPRLHWFGFTSSVFLSRSLFIPTLFLGLNRLVRLLSRSSVKYRFTYLILFLLTGSIFVTLSYEYLSKFIELRIFTLFNLSDSSALDTISTYDKFLDYDGFLDNIFGTNIPRFEVGGGRDPFFTRWYFGAGLITLILLELIKIILAIAIIPSNICSFYFYILFLYTDLKGDMVLTFFPLIYLLVIFNLNQLERGR